MELNKHGWSMKEMIILSSILFLFLLIAVFYIIRLYHGLEQTGVINSSNKQEYSYTEVEDFVFEAGMKYYKEFYKDGDRVKISTDKMKKYGFLTSSQLKSIGESKECIGYVEVLSLHEASSYIKCRSYETVGYEE